MKNRRYHKIAFEILLNTSMVNALLLYAAVKNEKVKNLWFREQLVLELAIESDDDDEGGADRPAKHRVCKVEARDN